MATEDSDSTNDVSVRDMMWEMRAHGGGFAKTLAEAWFRADLDNQRRIEQGWPDLIESYRIFVDKKRK